MKSSEWVRRVSPAVLCWMILSIPVSYGEDSLFVNHREIPAQCSSVPWPTAEEVDQSIPEELRTLIDAPRDQAEVCRQDSECVASKAAVGDSLVRALSDGLESESGHAFDVFLDEVPEVISEESSIAIYEKMQTTQADEQRDDDARNPPVQADDKPRTEEPKKDKEEPKKDKDEPKEEKKCDQKKDEWGCFCIYSPPKGGAYNDGEARFEDACLNALGDPKQPDRWKDWYNCKEIKSLKMLKGGSGTNFEGFEDWVKKMNEAGVKCFRGFMYSHSNGYKGFVKDRTQPIFQCIRSAPGVDCFSLHDCGCSTAKHSEFICDRALEIQKALKDAKSNMVVHFDAANEDQALPGGLDRVDKSKICAGNPDGQVVDEFFWRRAYVTKDGVWIHRHVKVSPDKAEWKWVQYSEEEFKSYCAGKDPFKKNPQK